MRSKQGRKEKKQPNTYVKANVTKESNTIINIIAAKEDKFVYEVIEDLLRYKHPEYFPQQNEVTA